MLKRLKQIGFIASLLLSLGSGVSFAQTNLSALDEGTRTVLTPEEAASVKVWVQSARQNLFNLLDQVNGVSLTQTKTILLTGIRNIVLTSNGKNSETLIRYVLNRSLKIAEMMEATPGQSLDQEAALLLRSAKLAMRYATSDLDLSKPYAQFGVDFAEFLLGVNESTMSAPAQLQIGTFALGLFRKDLSEDARSQEYASSMLILSNFLNQAPCGPTDSDAVKCYRNLRTAYRRAVEALSATSLQASHLSGMTAIDLGQKHSCAIVQGAVFCWGSNSYGQLGNGTEQSSAVPVQVVGLNEVTAIAVGSEHSCAISRGEVYCWGMRSVLTSSTSSHQEDHPVPYLVVGLTGATAIAASDSHTCAIANALAYCWGDNWDEVFPDPASHFNLMKTASEPVLFPGAKNVTALAVGEDHLCLVSDGKVLCAGNGLRGGMGTGDHLSRTTVDRHGVHPNGLGKSEMIVESGLQTCASSKGRIYCWGDGVYTPIMVGESNAPVQSALAMSYHCTKLNGMLMCWDENQYRETVANGAWKMSDASAGAIETIQALDLGVGTVGAVSSGEHGTCAVISLASGNQELYCSEGGRPLARMSMFDHLKIKSYSQPETRALTSPQGELNSINKDDLADFHWFQKTYRRQDGRPFTFEEFQSLSTAELKQIRKSRKEEDKIMSNSGEVQNYEHPVGCAAKRVLRGYFTLGLGGNGGC